MSPHDRFADGYEEQIAQYHCHLAEVLFGLCYSAVTPGDRILDVGIGTGLASELFHRAGLIVSGIDGSGEMLSLCRRKGFAQELVQHDLAARPWPFPEGHANHVVACGVFHFLGDLTGPFAEIARIQRRGGVFALTTMHPAGGPDFTGGRLAREDDGIPVYTHCPADVDALLTGLRYQKMKEVVCLVGDTPFRAVMARKG